MSTAPQPGWYPDPAGTPDFRWWDGSSWSDELSDTAQAPAPAGADSDERPRPPRHGAGRRVVAGLLIIALFVGTGIGIGLWLWRDTRATPETQARGGEARNLPSAAASGLGGQLDERTRTATIQSASMTMPDNPYTVHDDPMSMDGVFDVVFMAEAAVHTDYDGAQDWSAVVVFTSIDPSLVGDGDLERGGLLALSQLAARLYGGDPTVSKPKISDQAVDGRSGVLVTARVGYRIKHLPSRYDVVTALLVRLDDGTVVAAITSVPDDAAADVQQQAAQAMASLHVS